MTAEPKLRQDAHSIFNHALSAVDPAFAIRQHLRLSKGYAGEQLQIGDRTYSIENGKVWVFGAGKAGTSMAAEVERLLGRRIYRGIVNVKDASSKPLSRIQLVECGHPLPDDRGVRSARAISDLLQLVTEDDLVLCLISGGASALLPAPAAGISLEAKQDCTKALLGSGANIHEINTVRKHLSDFKGGQFAMRAMPAHVVSLILSDVIGNDLDVIGSGLTAPDRSTFADAIAVLEKYNLFVEASPEIKQRLIDGSQGKIDETPKPGHAAFDNTQNVVIGSAEQALEAASLEAQRLGYNTMILSSSIEGETREVGRVHAAIAREIVSHHRPLPTPACIISGGETTVTIKGKGKGGRNQEFVLAGSLDIKGLPSVVLFSAGTDGSDGPTDAAGAIADGFTFERGQSLDLTAASFLANNDSYSYFAALGDLVKTGPTNTNVMDIRLVLVG